jgi:hypothetical protein
MISPDGEWLAVSCLDSYDRTLEIVSRDGQRWVLQFQDFLSKKDVDAGIPLGNLSPQQWSADGAFLYFAPQINYSSGGGCLYAVGGQGLYRINVGDGTTSAILPSVSGTLGYFFAISPTGRRIAYSNYLGDGNPAILDIKTGQQTILSVGMDTIGDFTWSKDGLELAYATCQFGNEQNDCSVSKSAILIYSVQENSSRIILEMEQNTLHIEAWDGDLLKVFQKNEQCEESHLSFDVFTGQWLTPTPEP